MKAQYKVISTISQSAFGELVTKALNEGWELYGNPFVTGDSIYNQALVKREAV